MPHSNRITAHSASLLAISIFLPANIRYLILPFISQTPALPQAPSALPQLPADGPGFLVVKGNAADAENVNPIAALHKIYKDEGAALKLAWNEHELQQLQEEAIRAANPPAPKDEILYYWEVPRNQRKGRAK